MTHHCLLLDDYLDGRLSEPEAEAFEAHAFACDVCDDALALPEEIADGLRGLADCPCPPEVLDAALRTARRAPDRAAVAGRARRRLWAAPVALAALAIALVVLLPPPPPTVQPTTVVNEPAPPETRPSPTTVTPEPADGDAEVAPDAPTPTPTPAASRPRPSVRPRRATAPARTTPPVAEATPPTVDPAPTPAEVEEATRELALAFRLVADAQTDARRALREEAGGLSTAIDTALPF